MKSVSLVWKQNAIFKMHIDTITFDQDKLIYAMKLAASSSQGENNSEARKSYFDRKNMHIKELRWYCHISDRASRGILR